MISSAVIIPEEQPPVSSSSPASLKRRQSSFSTDSNKRPRIETQLSVENGASAGKGSPDHPRLSATPTSAAEEKKRGKRLFGALLGTLSQTTSKPAHRKRDEIEKRQRERLRKDNEERDQAVKRKKEELDRTRQVEQKQWNAESIKIRHVNMRATANFLQTKTEPRLYYKPWDLRPEEESQIKKQIEDVEQSIRMETSGNTQETVDTRVNSDQPPMNGDAAMESSGSPRERDKADHEVKPLTGDSVAELSPNQQQVQSEDPRDIKSDQPKEDDQGGGELVEGREDDVMY